MSQAALNAKIMLGGMGAPGGGGGGMGLGRPRKGVGMGAAYGAAPDAPAAAQRAQSSPALAAAEVGARACSGRALADLRRQHSQGGERPAFGWARALPWRLEGRS